MDQTQMEISSNSSAGTNSAAKDSSSAEAMSFYGTPSRARNSNASTTADAINNIASDRDSKTSTNTINVATSGASTTSSAAQGQARNTL